MSKRRKCTFNDDLQKESSLSNSTSCLMMELECYVNILMSISFFFMEEKATSINIYEAKNTRMLKKLQRETSAHTCLDTVMAVKAVKL